MEQKEKNMIHDRDIREPLFDYLEETYGKIRIIEEKMMGRSTSNGTGRGRSTPVSWHRSSSMSVIIWRGSSSESAGKTEFLRTISKLLHQ